MCCCCGGRPLVLLGSYGINVAKSIFEDFHQLICSLLCRSFLPLTVTTTVLSSNFSNIYRLCLDLVAVNRGAWCSFAAVLLAVFCNSKLKFRHCTVSRCSHWIVAVMLARTHRTSLYKNYVSFSLFMFVRLSRLIALFFSLITEKNMSSVVQS